MSDRKDFFSLDASREEVSEQAISSSPDDRWLAAIQLGQVMEKWAAELLWKLKNDSDESTRNAAYTGLRAFDGELLANLDSANEFSKSDFSPANWKIRPLPKYALASKLLYAACIQDIVGSEGATTGNRLMNLLNQASLAGGSGSLSRNQIREIVSHLVANGSLTRVDRHLQSETLDLWIMNKVGYPEFVIRGRESRTFAEIPVNEAQAVLKSDPKYMRRPNPDLGWEVLRRQYDIQPNEFHLVGEVLEGPWQGLFKFV